MCSHQNKQAPTLESKPPHENGKWQSFGGSLRPKGHFVLRDHWGHCESSSTHMHRNFQSKHSLEIKTAVLDVIIFSGLIAAQMTEFCMGSHGGLKKFS